MNSVKERLLKLRDEARERSKQLSAGGTDTYSISSSASTSTNSRVIAETEEKPAKAAEKVRSRPPSREPLKQVKPEPSTSLAQSITTTKSISLAGPVEVQRNTFAGGDVGGGGEKKMATEQKDSQLQQQHPLSSSDPAKTLQQSKGNPCVKVQVNNKIYMILSTIGKGGSSTVYLAYDQSGGSCVAIKCVDLSKAEESVKEAYANEIKLLEQLQGSPFVIRMLDFERRRNRLYVVMERGDIDLATFIQKKFKQIDDKFIKYHWQEMLRCVQVIHDRNIVHQDLKPANFLFVGASLKLIDFGIASNIPANKTSVIKGVQVGTLNYMSPEAIKGCYTDSNGAIVYKIPLKSDVWSLGCILYAMVFGRTPFHHINNQIAKITAISSEQHQIEIPPIQDPLLEDVIKRCLVRNVRERADIAELLNHPYLAGDSGGGLSRCSSTSSIGRVGASRRE